jgi:hypothetical protein
MAVAGGDLRTFFIACEPADEIVSGFLGALRAERAGQDDDRQLMNRFEADALRAGAPRCEQRRYARENGLKKSTTLHRGHL